MKIIMMKSHKKTIKSHINNILNLINMSSLDWHYQTMTKLILILIWINPLSRLLTKSNNWKNNMINNQTIKNDKQKSIKSTNLHPNPSLHQESVITHNNLTDHDQEKKTKNINKKRIKRIRIKNTKNKNTDQSLLNQGHFLNKKSNEKIKIKRNIMIIKKTKSKNNMSKNKNPKLNKLFKVLFSKLKSKRLINLVVLSLSWELNKLN